MNAPRLRSHAAAEAAPVAAPVPKPVVLRAADGSEQPVHSPARELQLQLMTSMPSRPHWGRALLLGGGLVAATVACGAFWMAVGHWIQAGLSA